MCSARPAAGWMRRRKAGKPGRDCAAASFRLPGRKKVEAVFLGRTEYLCPCLHPLRPEPYQGAPVMGRGSLRADILFVAEAPGGQEDRAGVPFVGPAGAMLDELLAGCGLSREEIYITNILKCHPPGNRDPQEDEKESWHSLSEIRDAAGAAADRGLSGACGGAEDHFSGLPHHAAARAVDPPERVSPDGGLPSVRPCSGTRRRWRRPAGILRRSWKKEENLPFRRTAVCDKIKENKAGKKMRRAQVCDMRSKGNRFRW